ncbi:MAG TPA: PilX N-terminal domain-containing pilus assembly protein [Gammaproteobacteria bacterium]|nr:PilX N-terminal domain-containing pilus assembly protein [Gammaproteobacteria bacterium]
MKQSAQGSALIVGLLLLIALTVLGMAGMKTARLELLMAGNSQFHAQAMNAAEAAIEAQINAASFSPSHTQPSNPITVTATAPFDIRGSSTIRYLNAGMAPDGGFSDDVLTHRFQILAEGEAPAGETARARVKIDQGIYVLAPAGK